MSAVEGADALATALSREMKRRGRWQKMAGESAPCALGIDHYQQTRQPMAVAYVLDSSQTGQARVAGYQLLGEARLSMRAGAGNAAMASWTLRSVRDYVFSADLDRPSVRGAEEEVLWRELTADLARQIHRRMDRFAVACALPAARDREPAEGRERGADALR